MVTQSLRSLGGFALVALVAACGSGSSIGSNNVRQVKGGPGVDATARTITLGVLTPLTGPVAAIGKPLTDGQMVYFDALNAAGGIDGWKIKMMRRDDRYSPPLHVQLYNEIVGKVAMISLSLGKATTKAIQPLADRAGVVIGAATQASSWVTDKVMCVIGTPYPIDDANALDYIVNERGQKDARIGVIYQNDEYGLDAVRGYDAAKSALHFNDVARAAYAATDTQFTSRVLAMKNRRADYVFLAAAPGPAGNIIATAANLNYHPTFVLQGPAWTEYLMTRAGTIGDTTDQTPFYRPIAGGKVWVLGFEAQWGDTSVPGMQQFLADTKKYSGDQIPDYYYMYGYAMAKVEAAILKKAIEGDDLSRAGILDAKVNLGTVDLGGLVPSVAYTPALGPVSRATNISAVDASVPGFLKTQSPFVESDVARSMTFTPT